VYAPYICIDLTNWHKLARMRGMDRCIYGASSKQSVLAGAAPSRFTSSSSLNEIEVGWLYVMRILMMLHQQTLDYSSRSMACFDYWRLEINLQSSSMHVVSSFLVHRQELMDQETWWLFRYTMILWHKYHFDWKLASSSSLSRDAGELAQRQFPWHHLYTCSIYRSLISRYILIRD
jgi:hypothetical protein